MGDMYHKINDCSSPSSASMAQTDEISLFLHQILLRSSSSSSVAAGLFGSSAAASAPENLSRPRGGEISAVDSPTAGCLAAFASGPIAANVTSSSPLGPSETENDEYDCESEEGLEALVESAKTSIPRSSSKRSRAAEVHNLSEKRRRSRINEKMKALQNLIPNSNKTDKASMLDEAIEYLKQLQLQVQMLAMRNGLSLHPVSLPGGLQPAQLSQMRMDFGEENRPLHPSLLGAFPVNQEAGATQNPFLPPNLCNSSNQQLAPNMLNIINSDASIGLEPPAPPNLGTYQFQSSSQDICREDGMRNPQKIANQSETSPLEFGMEAAAALGSFHRQSSGLKCNDSIETCIGGDWSESVLLKAIEQSLILPSHLNSMRTGISAAKDDSKIDRPNL